MSDLLAVFAHPDDETFICGGTLAKYAKEGHHVTLLCATLGEMGRRMGDPIIASRETLADLRQQELQAACDALSVRELRLLGLRDKTLEIYPHERLTQMILTEMERTRPTVIISFHEEFGGHPDHCAIGGATTDAFIKYRQACMQTSISCEVKLYYVVWPSMFAQKQDDLLHKRHFTSIDVKAFAKEKLTAFRAHRTQSQLHQWLWKSDRQAIAHLDLVEHFMAFDARQNAAGESQLM